MTRSIPASRAIASAVACRSPVSSTTSSPIFRSLAMARCDVARIGSATAIDRHLPSVDRHVHWGPCRGRQSLGFRTQGTGDRPSRRAASGCRPPARARRPPRSPPCQWPMRTTRRWRWRSPRSAAARTIAARERMLTRGLEARHQPQHAGLVDAGIGCQHHVGHGRRALGDRAGLVEDHGIDIPGSLKRLATLDQHPELGALAGGDHHRGREPPAPSHRGRR